MLFRKMKKWKCPHCDHYLEFRHQDESVAILSMHGHLQRRHGFQYLEDR